MSERKAVICPKLQFEIIYTPILDFSQVYRKHLSAFLRLVSNVNISNENTLTETLRMTFAEDKFDIRCNLDRVVFRTQGDLGRFTKSPQSPIRNLFDILDNIRMIETFGEIRAYVFAVSYINPIESNTDVVKEFSEKFLSETRNMPHHDYKEIVTATNKDRIQDFTALSTYNKELRHEQLADAFPFDNKLADEHLSDKAGYHMYFKRQDESIKDNEANFKLFKSLVEESYQKNNNFFNDNNS
ncbi:MAG: hypothetical protein WA958_15350 [Tunicatimonas sp.]